MCRPPSHFEALARVAHSAAGDHDPHPDQYRTGAPEGEKDQESSKHLLAPRVTAFVRLPRRAQPACVCGAGPLSMVEPDSWTPKRRTSAPCIEDRTLHRELGMIFTRATTATVPLVPVPRQQQGNRPGALVHFEAPAHSFRPVSPLAATLLAGSSKTHVAESASRDSAVPFSFLREKKHSDTRRPVKQAALAEDATTGTLSAMEALQQCMVAQVSSRTETLRATMYACGGPDTTRDTHKENRVERHARTKQEECHTLEHRCADCSRRLSSPHLFLHKSQRRRAARAHCRLCGQQLCLSCHPVAAKPSKLDAFMALLFGSRGNSVSSATTTTCQSCADGYGIYGTLTFSKHRRF